MIAVWIGIGLAILFIIVSDYQDSSFDNNWITKIRNRLKELRNR